EVFVSTTVNTLPDTVNVACALRKLPSLREVPLAVIVAACAGEGVTKKANNRANTHHPKRRTIMSSTFREIEPTPAVVQDHHQRRCVHRNKSQLLVNIWFRS